MTNSKKRRPTSWESVEITAPDGATSRLFVARAENDEAPVVLMIPALGMEAGYYDLFAKELADRGMHAAAVELRGNGTSSVRASKEVDFGYATFLGDLPSALRATSALFPRSPLYLMGHSLGGQLATAYAGLHPDEGIRGLILVASGTPYYKTWPFPASRLLQGIAHVFYLLALLVGYFPGKRIGFATREARTVMRDWSRLVLDGRFRLAGWKGEDIEEAISRISLPILSITLEKDVFVPVNVAEHMLAKMPLARIERWHWDPEAEGLPRTHHVRWPRRSEPIADCIGRWLETMPTAVEER